MTHCVPMSIWHIASYGHICGVAEMLIAEILSWPLGCTSSAPPHERLSSYRYNLKYITSENVDIIRMNVT